MSTPVLYSVVPFDATKDYTFKFSYSGNQAVKNKLIIKNNSTDVVVYNNTITTYRLEHTIPANTLSNGISYSAQIRVADTNDKTTDYSAAIVFKCLSTPSLRITNLTANQTIKNAIYEIDLNYHQRQGEKLNSFYVMLYNKATHQLLYQSPTSYNVENLSCLLEGLENNQSYIVKAYGQTISGVKVETIEIPFNVEYSQPSVFSIVKIDNDHLSGTISVKSNLILVDGQYNGTPTYIDGTKISLIDGTPVVFDQGFALSKNFSLQCIIEDFNLGKPILDLGNGEITIEICKANIYGDYAGQYYAMLKVQSGLYVYTLQSNYFSTTKCMINIRRVDSYFDINVREV